MKELIEYRARLTARLGGAAREFCAACASAADPFAGVENGWNVHQLAAHTRDVSRLIYGPRVRRTLAEENPEFENFDADPWMAAHYDRSEALSAILDVFLADVEDLCGLLSGLPDGAWSRVSRHATLGGDLTVQLWVERSLAHIEEHLAAVKKIENK